MSVPEPCTILTSEIFTALAPTAALPYEYSGLCWAIGIWNSPGSVWRGHNSKEIFMGATELDRKNELAAFLGHTLHDLVSARENSQCGTTAISSGTLYCQPSDEPSYLSGEGPYTDPYCNTAHTPESDPAGCSCSGEVAEIVGSGYDSNSLFFGRGPMQLSGNQNYIDTSNALGYDLCTTPDLVATNSAIGWATAVWFWMANTGSTETTSHAGVTTNGSFGESLNTINGSLECESGNTEHRALTVARLEKYCEAALRFEVALLSFDGCTILQDVYDSCIAGGHGTWGSCASCDARSQSPSRSSQPSESSSPSETPSLSLRPSKLKSSWPSETPSESSSPSESPSLWPSLRPSTLPSSADFTPSPTFFPTTIAPTTLLWYPNWHGGTNECLNDGNQEAYMSNNPSENMYSSLQLCCETHFQWTINTCLGSSDSASGTLQWYLSWSAGIDGACVQDCPSDDGGSCGGLAQSWEEVWGDKSECCTNRKWWDDDCLST